MSIAEVKDPYRDMNLSRIMIDRRILLPSSEVPQCILHYYERSKGDGARKLHYAIKASLRHYAILLWSRTKDNSKRDKLHANTTNKMT